MAKLIKQYYYSSKGEQKINCYHINLPKEFVSRVGFEDDDEITVYEEGDKIVIAKKWHCTCMECGTEWESGQEHGLWALCPRCHCGDVKFEINGELK